MISFYDVTLRDGNHAMRHSLRPEFVREYCQIAEQAGVWAVEVGHGNGIGASSFLVGKSKSDDNSLLAAARENLKRVKLAIHAIPGFLESALTLPKLQLRKNTSSTCLGKIEPFMEF